MRRVRSPVTRALAVATALAVAQCSGDNDYVCDQTAAAIVLPTSGTSISLRGRACVEGADGFVPIFGVFVASQDSSTALVRLSVVDSVTGAEVSVSEFPRIGLEVTPLHCDKGVVITVENMEPASKEPLTALVWFEADVEEFSRCEVSLEAL